MKKFLTMKNVLIAIAFTVLLLILKDNLKFVWGIIMGIMSILTPFFLGFMIAYILNFPYKFLHDRAFKKMGAKHKFFLRFKKPLAIVITYLFAAAIVAALIVIVAPQIVNNISSLFDNMPVYYKTAVDYVSQFYDFINSNFGTHFTIDSTLQEAYNALTKALSSGDLSIFFGSTTKTVFETLWGVITGTASGLYNFFMSVIISVYFLASKEQLCRQLKRVTVAFMPIKYLPKVYEVVDITDTKCGRFLVGDILDSAFIGLLCFIVMSIAQLPYAPLISVLVGISNIIPFFGPFIGAIPSAFILLLIDPWYMILFVIIIFGIQQLDGNVIKPKIIGNQLGISSFWVLFSVVVGGALFGVPGFILGTPIYAVIYTLVGKNVRNRIDDKGKIAQEALDFEVLRYAQIAAEQKKLREEREHERREKNHERKEKLQKLIHFDAHKKDGEEEPEQEAPNDPTDTDKE